MNPALSVIIPAFNAEGTISECLRSICSVSCDGIEVIVVDDGSSDGTFETCLSFGSAARVVQQENAGVSSARNHGIRLAKGDYIMFVDADDALLPGWFDLVSRYFGSSEDMVVFSEGASRERYQVDDLVASVVGVSPRADLKPARMPVKWASSPFSRIYSRRFLKTASLEFDSQIINGEDALFNLEAFLSSERIRFVGKPIYRYRLHGNSATHTFDRRFFASNERYLVRLEGILTDSGLYSRQEVSSMVDFSFCRSVEIAALRAAWIAQRPERTLAIRDIASNGLFMARFRSNVDTSRNPLHERVVCRLVEMNATGAAVSILRVALAIKGHRSSQERWVNI